MTYDTTHKSPNHSARGGVAISMIVLHATVGSGPSSLAWLCNPQPDDPEARVSIHYLIYKTGKIYQLVDDSEAAWHAGKSTWKGRDSTAIQKSSIGIELENANTGRDPYPQAQMDAVRELCQSLVSKYHIVPDMIVRHLDIAPGRKTDPAGFPFAQFVTSLYAPTFPTLSLTNKPTTIYQDSAATLPINQIVKGTLLLIDTARYPQQTGHISKTSPNFADLGFVLLADLDMVK